MADTLHRRVKQCYEEDLQQCYELLVREQLRKLRLGTVELAIDSKRDPYWGKKELGIVNGKHERGTNKAHEWLVLSVTKPHSVPLMALPLRSSADRTDVAIQLIRFAMSLPLKIAICRFDRGFYAGRLIAFMEYNLFKYLMLVPSSPVMRRYAASRARFISVLHQINAAHSVARRATTRIFIVKENDDVFHYATNLQPSLKLHAEYKQRWQIETDFRMMNEAKVKSKSNSHIIRYFYVMVQLVLLLAWIARKKLIGHIVFKRYLRMLVHKLVLKQGVT